MPSRAVPAIIKKPIGMARKMAVRRYAHAPAEPDAIHRAPNMQDEFVSARPNVQFTSGVMADERRPLVSFRGDAPDWSFRSSATLRLPPMLDLVVASQGVYSDLMIDVRSRFFADNHQAVWEVSMSADGELLGSHLYWKWYGQHQIILPLARFFKPETIITIQARPVGDSAGPMPGPEFEVEVLVCNSRHLRATQEERSIWVFSTARSGSTWVAHDIIGWRHRARVVDESGIGRMFAPLDWDAERFFAVEQRKEPYESGLAFETGQLRRTLPGVPPFERSFRDLGRELQVLNHMNFDLYHKLLRDNVLEHVQNEWGVRHYSRLVFKMPNDSHGADFIMRAFPKSRMVFLMRDGRDVMRSRFTPFASPILAETKDPALRSYAVAYYAHFWNFEVDIIRSAYDAHDPDRRYFLRYEDLRNDPEPQIASLLDAIDMAVPPEELAQLAHDARLENMPTETRGPDKARQSGKVGGFRGTFTEDEIHLMNGIMRGNLERYGYQVD